jgi:hypothetical protein
MTTLLKAAEHLQILGLSQTRKSPINFPANVSSASIEPQPSSSSQTVAAAAVTVTEPTPIYSKKARILDQTKTVSTSSMSSSSTMSRSTTPSTFREREYETVDHRATEQHSPLVSDYELDVSNINQF